MRQNLKVSRTGIKDQRRQDRILKDCFHEHAAGGERTEGVRVQSLRDNIFRKRMDPPFRPVQREQIFSGREPQSAFLSSAMA
jgi:hypothetical protein